MKEEALKLADYLEELPITYGDDIQDGFFKAVAMIRRLVEELDKYELQTNQNKLQTNQGEPVAWMSESDTCYSNADIKKMDKDIAKHFTIPLYTTPQTKPLSDEEIMEVYKQVSEPFGEKRLYEIHDFARAIEERHGIK